MKSFVVNIISPLNIAAIIVDNNEKSAINLLLKEFSLNNDKCKFQSKEIKWVRTELYNNPEILLVKCLGQDNSSVSA